MIRYLVRETFSTRHPARARIAGALAGGQESPERSGPRARRQLCRVSGRRWVLCVRGRRHRPFGRRM